MAVLSASAGSNALFLSQRLTTLGKPVLIIMRPWNCLQAAFLRACTATATPVQTCQTRGRQTRDHAAWGPVQGADGRSTPPSKQRSNGPESLAILLGSALSYSAVWESATAADNALGKAPYGKEGESWTPCWLSIAKCCRPSCRSAGPGGCGTANLLFTKHCELRWVHVSLSIVCLGVASLELTLTHLKCFSCLLCSPADYFIRFLFTFLIRISSFSVHHGSYSSRHSTCLFGTFVSCKPSAN